MIKIDVILKRVKNSVVQYRIRRSFLKDVSTGKEGVSVNTAGERV